MDCEEPMVVEPTNNDVPLPIIPTETIVVPPSAADPPPPKDKGYELYKSCKKNCKAVDTLALDFINDEIHHPVISCLREITKHDIMTIFNNPLFKNGTDKLEQCLICISLLDVIATTVKNPLYFDNFNKIESRVQACVKKIFQELRRLLKDWSSTDLAAFKSAQHLIIKYLRGLAHFFKVINYDVSFDAAVSLLARGVVRYQKQKPLPVQHVTRPSNISSSNVVAEERSALVEIPTNVTTDESDVVVVQENSLEDEKDEHDISDEHIFDVLDKQSKTKDIATIFNGVNHNKPKVNQSKKSNLSSMFRKQPCDSTKLQQQARNNSEIENDASAVVDLEDSARINGQWKRPAVEILESPAKKSCTDASRNNSTSQSPKKSLSSESTLNTTTASPQKQGPPKNAFTFLMNKQKEISSPQKQGPPKNAFTFLMNRQKEIAKEDKLKKAGKKTPAKSKASKS